MIDSTNPRVMADNIRELSGVSGSQASEISELKATVTKLTVISGEKYDTGRKWIDGSTIYGRTLYFENNISVAYDAWTNTNIEFPNIAIIVQCYGTSSTGGFGSLLAYHASNKVLVQTPRNGATLSLQYIVVEFTESAPVSLNSPAPDDTRSIEEPEIREEIPEEEPIEAEPIEEPVVEVKKTTRKKTTTTE